MKYTITVVPLEHVFVQLKFDWNMMKSVASGLLVVLGCFQTCLALPKDRLDANVNADVDTGNEVLTLNSLDATDTS